MPTAQARLTTTARSFLLLQLALTLAPSHAQLHLLQDATDSHAACTDQAMSLQPTHQNAQIELAWSVTPCTYMSSHAVKATRARQLQPIACTLL